MSRIIASNLFLITFSIFPSKQICLPLLMTTAILIDGTFFLSRQITSLNKFAAHGIKKCTDDRWLIFVARADHSLSCIC